MGNFQHQFSTPRSDYQRNINRLNIEFWIEQIPDESADFHTQLDQIAAEMNLSRHDVRTGMRVGALLRRFQKFSNCIREQGFHLNFARLATIEQHVVAVEKQHDEELERFLIEFFTPRTDNEVLPQPPTIARHLRAFVARLDEHAVKQQRCSAKRSARFIRNHNGTTRFTANLSDVEAAKLNAALRKQQREGMELVDAFASAISARTITKVHLNVFRDDTNVYHLLGYGPLEQPEPLLQKAAVSTIDPNASTEEYRPTPEIRRTVQLLDGTCRYPNCSRPAQECDLDHAVNFDEGGATDPTNLVCLCRFHHNIKTSGRVQYEIAEDRTITWYFPRSTKTTRPNGEAIPRAMFSQTWGEHEQKRVAMRRSA